MAFFKTETGFLEVNEDGTTTIFKTQFFQHDDHVLRIDTDDLGKKTASVILPRIMAAVDSTTGDILTEQRGFVAKDELVGLPTHKESGQEYVFINDIDVPTDYKTIDPVSESMKVNYRYDKASKRLVKK